MAMLVITHNFEKYLVGDIVTDVEEIAGILVSENCHNTIPVTAPVVTRDDLKEI